MDIEIDQITPQFDGIHYSVVLNKPYTKENSIIKRLLNKEQYVKSCYGVYGTTIWVDQDLQPLPPKLNKFISTLVVQHRLKQARLREDPEGKLINYIKKETKS